MKTYKQYHQDNSVDEGLIFGAAIERKLLKVLADIKATDDVGEKLNLLMKGLHFSLGGIAYELHRKR